MRRGQIASWVLLQPERINAYAQAVIRTLQADRMNRIYRMLKATETDSICVLSIL